MKNILNTFGIILILSISLNAQSPGNSLNFDGSNDYISCALPTIFNDIANKDISIEAWVKNNGTTFSRVIFAELNNSNFINISINYNYEVYFYVYTGGSSYTVNTLTTIPSGVWTHIACTWNSTTHETKIYFNGVEQSTDDGGTSTNGTDNLMTIGSRPDGTQFFNGELDELRIWSSVLDACTIINGMYCELAGNEAGLVAYYNFNHGTAGGTNTGITTLSDFSVNGYNGTLLNFALSGTGSNWVSSGATINCNYGVPPYGYYIETTDQICDGDSALWQGSYYDTAGIYYDSLITSQGCDSVHVLDLSVNYGASYMSTSTICLGDSVLWQGGYYQNEDIYYDSLSNVAGCDSVLILDLSVDTIDMVNLGPDSTLCPNDTITINAGSGYFSYLWSTGATTEFITIDSTGIGLDSAIFYVTVTNGVCISTDSILIDFDICSGKQKLIEASQITIYPNPNEGHFRLNLNSQTKGKVEISIFDITGSIVYKQQFIKNNRDLDSVLDLEHLNAGTYHIQIIFNEIAAYKTFVIIK